MTRRSTTSRGASEPVPPQRRAPPRAATALPVLLLFLLALPATAAAQWASCLPAPATETGTDVQVDGDTPGTIPSVGPRLVATSDGAVHVIWRDFRDDVWAVYYRKVDSFAGGLSTGVEQVSTLSADGNLLNASTPRLATDGTDLFAVWHEFGEGTETIVFRGRYAGSGWGTAVVLNEDIATHYAGEPQICADATGRVYVAWAQSDGFVDQIYLAVSQDGGVTWTTPATTDDTLNVDQSSHSAAPRLACDAAGGGHLYVTYLDHRNADPDLDPGVREVFFRRSSDGGVTFDTFAGGADEMLLTDDSHAADSQLAVDGAGLVVVTWLDVLGVGLSGARAVHSTDWGSTFSTITTLGSGGSTSLAFDVSLAAAGAGRAVAAYGRVEGYLEPTRVYATVFETSTGAWATEQQLSVDGPVWGERFVLPAAARTHVAASGDDVFVVWTQSCTAYDDGSGGFCGERLFMDVDVSWSTDGGANWTSSSGVTTKAAPGDSRATLPRVVVAGGKAAVVWDDRRAFTAPGRGAPDVYFNGIILP